MFRPRFAARFLRPAHALAVAAFGVLAALAGPGCKDKPPAEATKEAREDGVDVKLADKALAAAHLQIGKARTVPRRATVLAAGRIDFVPSRVARVGPPIAGRVGTVPVVPGQKVGRGAVLVTLESVEVGRSRAEFFSAKTRLTQAKAELDRESRLLQGGASSERALLVAQAEHATAQAQLRATEDRLSTLGLGAGASGQSVSLVSPIAGTVLELSARVGQPVGPTDTLVVVGETEQVWLQVDLYERDLGKVRLGDDVKVSALAFPGRTFEGRVDQLGAVVDPERHVLEARIVLPNPDGALKPGMTASARILGRAHGAVGDAGAALTTAVVVPRSALQSIDGQPFVFVEKEKGKFELRPVERGDDIEDDVEIKRGLADGEPVVIDGAFILKSEALKSQMGAND
jgi:cobalt-zinc-cadmium efflux system membrane fusion protein